MLELIGVGFIVAIGFLIILWKIDLEFFAQYHWQTDLAVSGGMTALFFGTYSGMVVAIVAGVFLSIFLYIARKTLRLR